MPILLAGSFFGDGEKAVHCAMYRLGFPEGSDDGLIRIKARASTVTLSEFQQAHFFRMPKCRQNYYRFHDDLIKTWFKYDKKNSFYITKSTLSLFYYF